MDRLRKAILALLQEEADTWAGPSDLGDDYGDLVNGFNEAFPDQPIDLATDVNWWE